MHDTFTLERTYPAAPERVFAAWADGAQKQQWFGPDEADNMTTEHHSFDFRVGGGERFSARTADGTTFVYDARFQDIVDGERIVSLLRHDDGRPAHLGVGDERRVRRRARAAPGW